VSETETFKSIYAQPDGIRASVLSKTLNLPRGTIYGHLDVLLKKGLITKILTESGTLFSPEPIETVKKLYDEELKKIEASKKNIEAILATENREARRNPKFTVFEGPHVAERYFKEILRSNFKEMVGIWPAKFMAKHVPYEVMDDFQKNRIATGKKMRILWPQNEIVDINKYPQLAVGDEKKTLREIRILPKQIKQETGFVIYGTKVTFLSPKSEYYGFTIDSIELSRTMLSQFEHFWSISKKFTTETVSR
jgi:sugar-specific transcriptional regulator TrmB